MKIIRNAFSLYELSIVLLIVGLLTASITVGSNIIEVSKTNKTIERINELEGAVLLFQLQFNQLPGDFTNASSYFSTCTDVAGNNCDGDGNGAIENLVANTSPHESWRALQHLFLGGFIDQSSIGVAGANGGHEVGKNILRSGFEFTGLVPTTITTAVHDLSGDALLLGKPSSDGITMDNPALNARLSYIIDNKLDDGLPLQGTVIAEQPAVPTTNCYNGAAYDTASETPSCYLLYFFTLK